MPRFLEKLVKHGWMIIVTIVILISWIPILWSHELKFDKLVFATEYYKTLVDLGKLLFGFWLANIFLKSVRRTDFLNHYETQWHVEEESLLDLISSLQAIADGSSGIRVEAMANRLETHFIRLDYLSDIILGRLSKYQLGKIGLKVRIYKHELREHVQNILDSLKNGDILPKRPLDEDIQHSINVLTKRLGNSHDAQW